MFKRTQGSQKGLYIRLHLNRFRCVPYVIPILCPLYPPNMSSESSSNTLAYFGMYHKCEITIHKNHTYDSFPLIFNSPSINHALLGDSIIFETSQGVFHMNG